MIKIILNNEELDIDTSVVVTSKKAQQLNGIQDVYAYSNNFNLKNSSKNRRLLGINYLPNSKAKSMTTGYAVDVVFNGCIFLKKQNLKVQKENTKNIPVYLLFSDTYFVAKAKEVLLSQINIDANYNKDLAGFVNRNFATYGNTRTAPISAQETSGLVVVEEVPILINIKDFVLRIFTAMGYSYTGDILTDVNLPKYYMSSNVGVYGPNGVPQFDPTKTAYDFILSFLKTFNGYIEVSDSSKSLGLYFWKNIETVKDHFVDYSNKFTGFNEYAFEGGLAKINSIQYSDSPDFYNGFFNNNKSVLAKSDYLTSDFGAGPLRLFPDADINEDGTLPLRVVGERSDPQTMNIFVFEEVQTHTPIYFNGVRYLYYLYAAKSPNILQIWQEFHQAYTNNISLPTLGILRFRYDAIMLSEFKMSQVFFIKQLSTYWLPLELNFSTKKDEVKVKCLMIEKTPIDSPIVFDFNMSVDFYSETLINDIYLLYSAQNSSPAKTMIITGGDLSKNLIFVNGVQILAFPTPVDVSAVFEFKVSSVEEENVISNSDVFFQFISQDDGISRIGKINVAHNGRANFVSQFISNIDELIEYNKTDNVTWEHHLNYCSRITTPIDIPGTLSPLIGEAADQAEMLSSFKILKFENAANVNVNLTIESLSVRGRITGILAGRNLRAEFILWRNGVQIATIYSAGTVVDKNNRDVTKEYFNISASGNFNVAANDTLVFETRFIANRQLSILTGTLKLKNVNWKFYVTEQI